MICWGQSEGRAVARLYNGEGIDNDQQRQHAMYGIMARQTSLTRTIILRGIYLFSGTKR